MYNWSHYFDPLLGPVDYSCVYDIKFNGNAREYIRRLIKSEHWPIQVKPDSIVTTKDSEINRARDILNTFFGRSLRGKKVLDYGCGNAILAKVGLEMGINVVSFDTKEEKEPDVIDDVRKMLSLGPYDHILLYDVIDHLDPTALELQTTLSVLKGAMSAHTLMHVRAHPFCSRHAMHTYHKLNKAYAHFFLTPDELKEYGFTEDPLFKCLDPYVQYQSLFASVGMKAVAVKYITHPVEPFFMPLLPFAKHHYVDSVPDDISILKSMSVSFVDMVCILEEK